MIDIEKPKELDLVDENQNIKISIVKEKNVFHELVAYSMGLLHQLKYFHWQATRVTNAHKTYGELYSKLDELLDEFVESNVGLYCHDVKTCDGFDSSDYIDDATSIEVLKGYIELLKIHREYYHPAIQNILDEMIALVAKSIYLLK